MVEMADVERGDADQSGVARREQKKGWFSRAKEKVCGCFCPCSKKWEVLEEEADGAIGDNEDTGVLRRAFDALHTSPDFQREVSPSLLGALTALNEEERNSRNITAQQRRAIIGLSILSALCISAVEATITMLDFHEVFFEEYRYYGAGAVTLFFSIGKNYLASKEFMKWLFRRGREGGDVSRVNNCRSFLTALLGVSLAFKPVFTLLETIQAKELEYDCLEWNSSDEWQCLSFRFIEGEELYEDDPEREILDMAPVTAAFMGASFFWIVNLVREAHSGAQEGISTFTRGADCCLSRQPVYERYFKKKKNRFYKDLSAGFRRLLREPQHAHQIDEKIRSLEALSEEKREALKSQLADLTERDEESEVGSNEREIRSLQDQQVLDEQIKNLLTLHSILQFGREGGEEYYITMPFENRECSTLSGIFCNRHPCWYNGLYNTGRIIGMGAAVSLWYGWVWSIYNIFGVDPITSSVLGSIASGFFIPYMMEEAGKGFSNLFARCANYNPIQGTRYVDSAAEHLNYGRGNIAARSLVGTFSFFLGALVNFPSANLGYDAMSYPANYFLGLPMDWQTSTGPFYASVLVFSFYGYNSWNGFFQEMITKASKRCRMPQQSAQQHLASLYKRANSWLEKLPLEFVGELDRYMTTAPEEWIVNREREGKDD